MNVIIALSIGFFAGAVFGVIGLLLLTAQKED